MTAVIAVTSGKAKVGKSILSANLARYLNQNGHRTGLLMAGANRPVWGVAPSTSWTNILDGRKSLDAAIHQDVFGIDMMVAQGNGAPLRNLSAQAGDRLDDPLGILDALAYLIVDISSGSSMPALACCLAATENVLVLTPDTPAISATYEWLAQLMRHGFKGSVNLILNKVRKPALAQSIFVRFRELTQKRLKIQANLWGTMSCEENMEAAVALEQPLSQIRSQSRLLRDIHGIGDRLMAEQTSAHQNRPLKAFLQDFLNCQQQLPARAAASTGQDRGAVETEPPELTLSASEKNSAPKDEFPPADNKVESLAQLGTILNTIARELNAIRHLLESRPLGNPVAQASDETQPTNATRLDLDAFLKLHQNSEER